MIRLDRRRAMGTALIGLLTATVAVALWSFSPIVAGSVIAVGVIAVVLLLVTIDGKTLPERRNHRSRFETALDRRWQVHLYSTNKVGTIWDGQSATMAVSFSPTPWQISIIDRPDPTLPRAIPIDLLRRYLVQGDITLERMRIVQMGYRRFARTAFTKVYEDEVGDTPLPTSLTTIIEISVNLEKSMAAVQRRNISNSVPAALGATVNLVAGRVAQALKSEGYEARLQTAREDDWMNSSILAWTNDGLLNEQWDHLGATDHSHPVAVSRPSEWTPRAAEKWWNAPADRMAAAITIEPGPYRTQTTHAQFAYAYPAAHQFPDHQFFLERALGSQGDSMTEILPLAVTDNPWAEKHALNPTDPYPVSVPGTGLGVFLGVADTGGRAFMNTQTGGEIMWVHAPAAFIASLAARISAVGGFVALHLQEEAWAQLCALVNPDLMKWRPDKRMSVEIYKDVPPEEVKPGTAVIVWCPKRLPKHTTFSMVMDKDGHAVTTTPDGITGWQWEPSAREREFLPATAPRPIPEPAT